MIRPCNHQTLTLAGYHNSLASRVAPVQTVVTAASQKAGVRWQMLRLDLLDDAMSGNKLFKLLPFFLQASEQGINHLLSFGGMHSNHLHALASAGRHFGFATTGIVRGYPDQPETPTLADLRHLGMNIRFADKKDYARRYSPEYCKALADQYQALLIPEGGNNAVGAEGASSIASVIKNSIAEAPDYIGLACGTGCSLQGILQSPVLEEKTVIRAYAALGNAEEIRHHLMRSEIKHRHWQLISDYQFGGFAKIRKTLAQFIQHFEKQQAILLDPVYTAKMCYAIDDEIHRGVIRPGSHIVSLHSGGLQGMRAMRGKIERLALAAQEERYEYA